MVFDQYVCGCQLLYHNCCFQDYPLWYLIYMFMVVSYCIKNAAVRFLLYIIYQDVYECQLLYHNCCCQEYL